MKWGRGISLIGDSMIPVQVRITKRLLDELDKILEAGIYSSRSEIIRDALRKHINGFADEKK
jgi:metal-responsive CopG/Arc/MetJ family transcriptional regulator